MTPLYKKVFQWVTGTHAGLLLLVLVVSLVSCEEEIEAISATVVPPPPPPPFQQNDPSESKIVPPVKVDLQTLILLPEESLRAMRPKPKKPKPEPKPEPEPEPEPEPQPEPEPEPQPEPERISYEEFVKKHGKPEPVKRPQPRPSRPVDVPDFRVDNSSLDSLLAASDRDLAASMNAAQQRVVLTYGQALVARLNAAWNRPPSLAGRDLRAVVNFRVNRDGRLSEARIVRSSGNQLFDSSVLQVFQTLGKVDAPPPQAARTYEIAFRNIVGP